MIDRLYNLVNKGSWRALSLILAILLTVSIFLNTYLFVTSNHGASPLLTLWLVWGICILWIHGIGFSIRKQFWQVIFSPFMGYICGFFGLFYIYLYR